MHTKARDRPKSDGMSFISPFIARDVVNDAIESHTVPVVRQRAPDFTLPPTSGEKVTLSSLRGKPVLNSCFPVIRWAHVESNPDHKREDGEPLDAIDRIV